MANLSFEYLAGIIDGEGCLTIQRSRNGKSHTFKIRVSMSHKRVLKEILDNFGGHLWGPYKRNRSTKEKLIWEWCIYGREAFELLKKIYPFLIVKQEEAHIGWDFCNQLFFRKRNFGKTQITEDELIDRDIWYLALQAEKRGGEYQYDSL